MISIAQTAADQLYGRTMHTGISLLWLSNMRYVSHTLAVLVLLSLTLLPNQVDADAANTTAERLQAQVPDGWFQGVDKQVGELAVAEYFPPGTEQYWAQKLVFESLTSTQLPDPIIYVNGLAEQQSKQCTEFNHYSVFSGFENGYPTEVQVLHCGAAKLTGKPIVTMIKAIQGNQSLYTITRIWRVEHGAADKAAKAANQEEVELLPRENMAEFAAWSNTIAQIQACDDNLPAHRCQPLGTDANP